MDPRRLVAAAGFLLVAALAPPAPAGAATDPKAVVADFGDRVLRMLGNEQLSQAERRKQFHDLLDQDFDFNTIARFVLGRYWNPATAEQKQQFTQAFKDYVVQSYSNRFNEFSGTTFKVTGERPESQDTTIIHTDVQRRDGSAPAKVDWRVIKVGDGYKISEVIVDGISMSLTHRQEFASIMQRNGGDVADLIAQLRQKIAASATQ